MSKITRFCTRLRSAGDLQNRQIIWVTANGTAARKPLGGVIALLSQRKQKKLPMSSLSHRSRTCTTTSLSAIRPLRQELLSRWPAARPNSDGECVPISSLVSIPSASGSSSSGAPGSPYVRPQYSLCLRRRPLPLCLLVFLPQPSSRCVSRVLTGRIETPPNTWNRSPESPQEGTHTTCDSTSCCNDAP